MVVIQGWKERALALFRRHRWLPTVLAFVPIALLRQVERWMQDRGGLVIFLFALIPNPFFDFIGFAAGSMDYPVRRFLVFCALGKAVKFLAIAYAGYYGIDVAIRYFSST